MNVTFTDIIWYWRGPAPWYFVTVPEGPCQAIKDLSASVTYGWGMIPVTVRIGQSRWQTALWPKDGSYIVPIKASVRKAEKIEEGDRVTVELHVN